LKWTFSCLDPSVLTRDYSREFDNEPTRTHAAYTMTVASKNTQTHRHTAVCYSMSQHHIFPFSFIGSFPCGISTTFVMSHRIKVMLLHLESYAWCRTTFWPLIIPISCKVVFYLEVQIGKQTTMYRHHQGYIILVCFGKMHSGMPIDNNVTVIDRDAKYSLLNAHILLIVYLHRKHH
jgi:hypothetical protein